MSRSICLAAAFALFTASAATAQPRIIEIPPPPFSTRSLEDSVEQLEASLDVKRAYVKAAEVGVAVAKSKYNNLAERKPNGGAEVEQAKLDVDAALAQLDIRKAEMREVEIRLKQTRKRLDESKPVVTRLVIPSAVELEAGVKLARAKLERAKVAKLSADADLARMKKLVESGIVPREEILAVERAATVADLDLLIATTELKLVETKLKDKSPREVSPEPKPVK